jgi:hypothetical protein
MVVIDACEGEDLGHGVPQRYGGYIWAVGTRLVLETMRLRNTAMVSSARVNKKYMAN